MSVDNPGFSIIIVRPASVRLEPLSPVFRKPRNREVTAIGLPAGNCATICVMPIFAFAAPRRRTFWKRQTGGLGAQEALVTQPVGCWARPRPSGNAHSVPRLFEGATRFRLYHAFKLDHWSCRRNQHSADLFVGQLRAPTETRSNESSKTEMTAAELQTPSEVTQ
jgi:hypothetical protein